MFDRLARYAVALLLMAFVAMPARADDIAGFYKGRQLRFIIGSEPGSEYDIWARIVARHMGQYLPGKPTIVPQNIPGAGQIIATNHLFNIAERDGSVIGMIGRNLPYMALTRNAAVRFDPARFNWIGSPEVVRRVCAVREASKVKTLEELRERETLFGGAGAGTAVTQTPTLLARLLGLKFKVIEGHRSGPGVMLAVERGEIDGICITWEALATSKADALASGRLRILFNLEPEPIPGAGAPSIYELVRTDEQRRVLAVFNSSVDLGRPIVAPPGVPAERVAALRQAFEQAVADPEMQVEASRLRLAITLIKGETLAARVDDLMRTPPELVQAVERLMQ